MKRSVFLEEEDSRKRRKRFGTEVKVNKRDKEERSMLVGDLGETEKRRIN